MRNPSCVKHHVIKKRDESPHGPLSLGQHNDVLRDGRDSICVIMSFPAITL